jgi:hypothetical protein
VAKSVVIVALLGKTVGVAAAVILAKKAVAFIFPNSFNTWAKFLNNCGSVILI